MWSVERAPDGGLNIIVEDETITQVAQRLMCWSKHDARITYVFGAPFQYFHIPPALFSEGNYGDLMLKPGGEAIEPVTCSRSVFNQPRLEDVSGIDPNACVDDVASPTVSVDTAEVTNTTAVVRWSLPWDGTNIPESPVHQALFDVVYRKQSDDPNCVNRWKHLRVRGWERSVRIGGLTPGTTYEVAVGSVDKRVWPGIESSLSTVVTFTTTGVAPGENSADLCDDGTGSGLTITVMPGDEEYSAQGLVTGIPAGGQYTYQFIAPSGGANVPAVPMDIPPNGVIPSTPLTPGIGWVLRVCNKLQPAVCQDSARFNIPFFGPQPLQVCVGEGDDVNSARGRVDHMVSGKSYTYQFIAPAGGTNVPAAPAAVPANGLIPSTPLTEGTGWLLRVCDNSQPAVCTDSAPFDIPFDDAGPVTVAVAQGADVNSAQGTVTGMSEGVNYVYQFIAPAGGTNVPATPAPVPADGAIPSTTLTTGTGWVLRVTDDATPPNEADSAAFDIPFTEPTPVTVAVAQGADVNSAQGTVTGMSEGVNYVYQFIAPAGGTNVPAAPAAVPAGGAIPSTTLTAGTGWVLRVSDDATPPNDVDSAPFDIPFSEPTPVTVAVAQGADVNSAQGTVSDMTEGVNYVYQFIAPAGGTNVPAAPAAVPAGGAIPSTTLTAGTGWVLRVTDDATPPNDVDSAPFDVPFSAGVRRSARGK